MFAILLAAAAIAQGPDRYIEPRSEFDRMLRIDVDREIGKLEKRLANAREVIDAAKRKSRRFSKADLKAAHESEMELKGKIAELQKPVAAKQIDLAKFPGVDEPLPPLSDCIGYLVEYKTDERGERVAAPLQVTVAEITGSLWVHARCATHTVMFKSELVGIEPGEKLTLNQPVEIEVIGDGTGGPWIRIKRFAAK